MKLNKTYKTLANAYKAAYGCDPFIFYDVDVLDALEGVLKAKGYTKPMIEVALANVRVGDHKIDGDSVTSVMFVLKQTDEGFAWDRVAHTAKEPLDEEPMVYFDGATEDKPTPTKGSAKLLTKAQKKAIRSECIKLAKGDREKYDELCKERGVDNHRG